MTKKDEGMADDRPTPEDVQTMLASVEQAIQRYKFDGQSVYTPLSTLIDYENLCRAYLALLAEHATVKAETDLQGRIANALL